MADTTVNNEQKRAELRQAALNYHEFPTPGKISVTATKQLVNQHDLALAYSPGVAAPCEEIVKDPNAAFRYTARGNLVAVITNGTAVLGLGDIGPLASMHLPFSQMIGLRGAGLRSHAHRDLFSGRSRAPHRDVAPGLQDHVIREDRRKLHSGR